MRTRQAIMPRRYSRMGIDGDGSTLNLDFTTMGALDSRFTFTRSTTATYVNSLGYVASAAINEARFDYDPTTLAAKGLLIEGSATNLQRYSATFEITGSYWYQTLGTNAAGTAATAPDNTSTPRRLTEPASGTSTGLLQISGASAGIAASTTYTVSFWAKAGSRTKVLWRCDGGGKDVGFNLDTGVATVVAGTFTTTRMTAYPNGWYRCEATWANVNASGFPSIILATGTGITYTISYTCNSSYAELWGFQLETGTGASSYIPTTTAQVTKAADFCKMTQAASQMSWLQKIDTCTFLVDFMPMTQRGGFNSLVRLITTTSQGHEFYVYDTVAGVSLTTVTKITASTNLEQTLAQSMALNSTHKVAYSIDATNGLRSLNGSTVSAANPIALPTGTNSTFGIGSSGLDASAMYGHIRGLKYYPTALTQAQINVLTT